MLTLPIKKKWFDMILSGEKREEYRDDTLHYRRLFEKRIGIPTRIRLRNGYRLDSPTLECTVVPDRGSGRLEWGAPEGWRGFVLAIQDTPELLTVENS